MVMNIKITQSQKGIAMISALALVGIVSTTLAYLFQISEIQRNNGLQQRERFNYSRVTILANGFADSRVLLYEALLNPSSINEELRNCMTDNTAIGGPSTLCIANTDHHIQYGVNLAPGVWMPMTNINNLDQVVFNSMGQLCVDNLQTTNGLTFISSVLNTDPSCSNKTFRLSASFRGICSSSTPSCEMAAKIIVNIHVTPSNDSYRPYLASKEISFLAVDEGQHVILRTTTPANTYTPSTTSTGSLSPVTTNTVPVPVPPPPPVPLPPILPSYQACGPGQVGNSNGSCRRLIL